MKKINIAIISLIGIVGFAGYVFGADIIQDLFRINRFTNSVFGNSSVVQWVFGSTTTTTDDRVEIYGDAYVSSTLTTGEVCLDSDCISDWSSIQGTNYWQDDGTNLSPVTSTRGVSVTGLTTDTLNISTITNECLETDADGNVVGSGSACGSGSGGLTEISSVGDGISLVADGANGYVKSITSTNELLTLTDNGDDVSLTMSSSPTFGLINATSGTSTIIQLSSTLASIYDLIIGNTLTFISGVINGAVNATGLWTFDILPQSTATPIDDKDLVTKVYVDAFSQGLIVKDSCIVATVASGTLATDFEEGDVVDTYSLVAGDRVLIKDQASSTENGIYVINATGTPTRATDYDEDAEILAGTFTYIINGGANENTQWVQYEPSPTINVDPLNFRALPDPPDFTASNGIKMVGSDAQINHDSSVSGLTTSSDKLAVNYDDSSIGVVAEKLVVKALGITNDMLAGAIDLATKVTGILGISNGGTGATTAQGARTNLLPSQAGNTGKALVTDGSDTYWGTVSSGDGGSTTSTFGNTKMLVWVANGSSYSTWTDMSPDPSDFLSASTTKVATTYYKKFDLTNSYRFRTSRSLSVAGYAGSYIYLQYSYDRVNWYDAGNSDQYCTLVGTGNLPCPWATLVPGARTDVWLRYRGDGGNGAIDPRFYNLVTEFTTYASTEEEDATTTDSFVFVASPTANQTWANMPLAKSGTYYNGFGTSYHYRNTNLYKANRYRILARIATTTNVNYDPISTMRIDVQYSYNKTNWYNLNSGLASPGVGSGELDISQTPNEPLVGDWVDVAEGGKGNVWLRFVGYGGNGVKDIYFRNLEIQFETYLNADVTRVESDPIWLAASSSYLTTTTASATYQPIGSYLTSETDPIWSNASSSYLTTTTASSTYFKISTWLAQTTDNLTEGITNLYFTIARARESISSLIPAITYSTSTGQLSLTSGYEIPITASTTNWNNTYNIVNSSSTFWNTAYSWGNHALAGYLTSISGLNISLLNNDAGYVTTTSGVEVDPIWSAASTSVAYLANNQTFTGENTFTGLTQLATTTATGTLSVTGAVSGGLNSQFGSAGNYLKVEEFDVLPGIGFNMPMISMYNDNTLGFPNDVGAIRKGLFIADPDAGIPLMVLAGSTLSDPYATIIYSTSSNVLIIDTDATTDGSQIYIQEAEIGSRVYPLITGIDDDGETELGIAVNTGLLIHNPTGSPFIGWSNGDTGAYSLMTYGEDGLTLIGGIDAVANATTSVGNGIVISETYRSSGRLLGDAGVGARAGVLFRDNAGGGLLGPGKDLGLLNSVVIEQAVSSGDPWEGGMELYTFASTTGKSSSTKNVSFFVDKTVFNDDGLDLDFIIESDTNANALFLDGASGYLGLGTSTPQYNLSIVTSSNWLSMTRSDGYGLWFDWVTSTIDFPIIRGLASTTAIFGLDLSAVPLAESAVLVDEDSDNETSLSFMNNPLTIIAGLVYNFLINSFTFSGFKIMNFENWDADANFFILDAENEDVFITSGSSWAGYATCYTTNGELGHCTSAVNSSGQCTCASNN